MTTGSHGLSRSTWLPYDRVTRPPTATRLFCFAHAGGSASSFLGLQDELPPWLTLSAAQMPGRERRIRETAHVDLHRAVDEFLAACGNELKSPYAIFGYSLGGLIGYEICLRLIDRGDPLPIGLFVAATRPPIGRRLSATRRFSDDDLLDYLRDVGGTPAAFFEDRALQEVILPTLRADLCMAEAYRPGRHAVLPIPISCWSGDRDRLAGPDEMSRWSMCTSAGDFKIRTLDHGHFFLQQEKRSIAQALIADLSDWGAGSPSEREQ